MDVDRAKKIKKVGATGAYTKEFDDMQDNLDDIEKLLHSTETIDLDSVEKRIADLGKKVTDINDGPLNELRASLVDVSEGNQLNKINLERIAKDLKQLEEKTKVMRQNGTSLQEANVQGALNLVQQAKERADRAVGKADYSYNNVTLAQGRCKAIENVIASTRSNIETNKEKNKIALDEIKDQVAKLNNSIPHLNDLICDRHGDSCDTICGGAGCAICGEALLCENGA